MSSKEEEDIYVPLNEKKQMESKKRGRLIFWLIVLGAAFFFAVVLILRSGGMPRILFVTLALALAYLINDAYKRLKTTK